MISIYGSLLLILFILGGISQQSSGIDGAFCVSRFEDPKMSRNAFVFASLILISVAGLRYKVGADYGAYYYGYGQYAAQFWSDLKSLDDPGIKLIYALAIKIWDDPASCIYATAAVTLGFELRYIYRNTDQLAFSLVLFLLIVWAACFNGMRQALAVSVLCFGFPYLKQGRFWPYLVCVILAFLCHRSALLMILPWFVCRRKFTWSHVVILSAASVVVLLSTDKLLALAGLVLDGSSDTSSYLNDSYWTSSVNSIRVLAYCAPVVFFTVLLKDEEKSEEDSFYLNLLLMHALVSVVTSFSTCIARMTLYTSPYLLIAIPELLKKREARQRQWITLGIVVLYFLFALYEDKGQQWHWMWNR